MKSSRCEILPELSEAGVPMCGRIAPCLLYAMPQTKNYQLTPRAEMELAKGRIELHRAVAAQRRCLAKLPALRALVELFVGDKLYHGRQG